MQINSPQTLFQKQKIYRIKKEQSLTVQDRPIKVIVLYENESAELPVSLADMLNKLILACKFNKEEALYINNKINPVSLAILYSTYQPEVILIFGEMKLSNNLAGLKKNYPYEINGVKILRTETLESLEKIKAEKSALWESLQQMFGLK